MPPRKRPPAATVTVDPVHLVTVLHALAQYAPATFRPGVATAAVELEAAVAQYTGDAGIFDLGWGLRATDGS